MKFSLRKGRVWPVSWYVWTEASSGKKKSRIQKYQDTCRRGPKLRDVIQRYGSLQPWSGLVRMRMCGERHSRARDLRKSNISTVRCARAFMHPVSHVAKDYLLTRVCNCGFFVPVHTSDMSTPAQAWTQEMKDFFLKFLLISFRCKNVKE